MVAYQEVRKKATEAKMNIYKYGALKVFSSYILRLKANFLVTSIADPSLNVVLLEDSAAVVGVAIALGAVTTSSLLNSSIPDCIGSIAIGVLLGTVATFIIRTNAAHLVGRSLPKHVTDDIVEVSNMQRAEKSRAFAAAFNVTKSWRHVCVCSLKSFMKADARCIDDAIANQRHSIYAPNAF